MSHISFTQPPAKAIKYIEKKYPDLHFDYDEIMHEAHHKAFTVAKVTKLDLLTDIQSSLTKARKEGIPFEAWKKEIKPTLLKKGWYGKTEVTNPKTGEVKEIFVGSRRLRTVFYTNTRVAYNVGRWEHQSQLDDAPYLRYVAILDNNTRAGHSAMHGVIRHRDDAIWNTNYPPNGWLCRCRVQAYSMDSIKRRGWEGQLKRPMAKNTDKDWAYDVRKGSLAKVKAYREQKVLDAPKGIKESATTELTLDELYLKSIRVGRGVLSPILSTYLLANRPKQKIDKNLDKVAGYQVSTQTILHKTWETPISAVRHETGHHVDNINGFWSLSSIDKLLKRDTGLWTNLSKKEITALLSESKNLNVGLHDLFFINSSKKFGIATRDEKTKLTRSLIAKESFANIFEILLADDDRVDILRLYFPATIKAVEKMMKELK